MTVTSIAVVTPPGVTVVTAPYAPAGPIVAGTSTTPNSIVVGGTYTWEMDQIGLGFMVGTRVRASASVAPTNWIEGLVTSFDGADLVVQSDLSEGLGTFNSWNISIAGQPGDKGDKGDTGPTGPTGPQGIVSLDSPFFTGDPRAPTPLPDDNDNSLATTQFVKTQLANYQPYDPDLTSLAAANQLAIYWRSAANTWAPVIIGTGLTFTSGTLSAGGMAPLASPTFTGDPKAPTPPLHDSDTSIPTTQWVTTELGFYALLASPTFTGTPSAPTPADADDSTKIATTEFVKNVAQPLDPDLTSIAGLTGTNVWFYRSADGVWLPVAIGANLLWSGGELSAVAGGGGGGVPSDSPVFTGDPRAPTAPAGDNDNTIANTQWVQIELSAYAKLASPSFSGAPLAPTPTAGDNTTKIATTAFVQTAIAGVGAGYAPLDSPALTGNPTAPTPLAGDNDTSIATTAFVQAAITAGAFAPLASPVFTGNPTAPTPATADNDASIATTAFVKAQAYAPLASPVFTGTPTAPTVGVADNSQSIATTGFVKAQEYLRAVNIVKFINSGTYTPSVGLKYAIVECIGAGGGGGGAYSAGAAATYQGGGGGGGGYSRRILTAAQIGASQSVTVGTGGIAGAAGGPQSGGNGTATSFGTLCVANGGSGGGRALSGVNPNGGAGGAIAGAVGDIIIGGSRGGFGMYNTVAAQYILAGDGAPGPFGGATGTFINSTGETAPANSGAGGSGGSAHSGNATGVAGGAGASGLCIVTEFFF